MGRAKHKTKSATRVQKRAPSPTLFNRSFYVFTLVLVLAVYHGIVDNYLFNDDFLWLSKARHEMDGNVLTFRVIGFFRPFINLSFFVTERLAPGNLPLYYVTNLLLHWLNGILLFHLGYSLFRNRTVAAATAVYFLIASVHFGAVAWISARTTLFSTTFLLLSLILVTRAAAGKKRLVVSLVLYVAALASKETAIVGLFLVGLVYLFCRGRKDTSIPASALISFVAITAVYLIARRLVVGGFVQDNWGPGLHVFGNLAGAVLFQYYTLPLAALPALATAGMSTAPVWIELLVLPVIVLLLLLAKLAGRLREIGFALAWTVLSLVPVALLKFRFFASDSLPHTRYYYLASFGVCLSVVVLLSALWNAGRMRRASMALAAFVFVAICVVETIQVRKLEQRWGVLTSEYRMIVSLVESKLDQAGELNVCVVDDPPIRYSYLKAALLLERPSWKLVEGDGRQQLALGHTPCLYVKFLRRGELVGISATRLE